MIIVYAVATSKEYAESNVMSGKCFLVPSFAQEEVERINRKSLHQAYSVFRIEIVSVGPVDE